MKINFSITGLTSIFKGLFAGRSGKKPQDEVTDLECVFKAVKSDISSSLVLELLERKDFDSLIKLISDDKNPDRYDGLIALEILGDKRAVDPLIGLLQDDEPVFRSAVIFLLEYLGDLKAVDPLIKLLQSDNDLNVLGDAVTVLGQLGDSRAIRPISELARKFNQPKLQADIRSALEELEKNC